MSLTLHSHPFSSYCQKVLVALYKDNIEFEYRTLEDPSAYADRVHPIAETFPTVRAHRSRLLAWPAFA